MKLVLNTDDLTDDFYDDVRMFGIVSNFKNYKFVWKVNSDLGLQYRCNPDIEIRLQKKSKALYFPVYQHNVKNTTITFYCYHNYYEGEALLPELKNVDFIFLVKGAFSISNEQWSQLLSNYKSVGCVQMVTEISPTQIKNKANLIF